MKHHDAAFRRIIALASAYVKRHSAEALAMVGEKPGWLGATTGQREGLEDGLADDIATVRRHIARCDSRIEELEDELAGTDDDGEEPSYNDGNVPEAERSMLASVADGDEDDEKPHECPACAAAKMKEPTP